MVKVYQMRNWSQIWASGKENCSVKGHAKYLLRLGNISDEKHPFPGAPYVPLKEASPY
jgi:hypothetical protein